MPFKIGDVVKLKSGSPTMTITQPQQSGGTVQNYLVAWFHNGEPKTSSFPEEALEKSDGH